MTDWYALADRWTERCPDCGKKDPRILFGGSCPDCSAKRARALREVAFSVYLCGLRGGSWVAIRYCPDFVTPEETEGYEKVMYAVEWRPVTGEERLATHLVDYYTMQEAYAVRDGFIAGVYNHTRLSKAGALFCTIHNKNWDDCSCPSYDDLKLEKR